MPTLPADRARTLKEAFQVCDVGPLRGELQRFYVDLSPIRSMEAINSISTRLDFLEPGEFRSLLFTGHRGCGKSTELRRLQQHWQKDYRVIYLEADDELDINDAEYTDLYLVIIKRVTDDLAELGLTFDDRILNSFQQWFLEITDETVESVEKSVSLETTAEVGAQIPLISKLIAKLMAQIKGSNTQKQTIRQKLERDVGRLKADMNALLLNGFEKLQQQFQAEGSYQKGFLIIFDNLDRVPPKVGDRLYFDYATQLQELNCTLIYTVPISVVYSDKNLNNAFGRPNVVPMVNIYEFDQATFDLTHNKLYINKLGQLIGQRIDLDAIFAAKWLVAEMVIKSGGHVRQLMQMTATACLTAATRGHAKVQEDDITYAIKQEQANFERVVPAHHYPLLVEVCSSKRIDQNEDGQKMLFNTSVLEYESNDRRWNYINPVVRLSDAFQEALRDANPPRTTPS